MTWNSGQPRYAQLKELLLKEIRDSFTPGQKFHTQRELMKQHQLGYATVEKALNQLVREGWLVREQGRGSFVAVPSSPQTNVLGALVPSLDNHFYSQILRGAIESAQEEGFHVIVNDTLGDPILEKALFDRLVQEQHAAGFLLCLMDRRPDSPVLTSLRERKLPFVVFPSIDFSTADDIDYVVTDDQQGAYLATQHLIKQGCHNIAFVAPSPEVNPATANRLKGYQQALADAGIPFRSELWIQIGSAEKEAGSRAAEQLAATQPDGVFAFNDLVAIGILLRLKSLGITVGPGGMRLIGFDDNDLAGWPEIDLSTIRQPRAQIGRLVTEILCSRCRGQEPGQHQVILQPELIIRGTA